MTHEILIWIAIAFCISQSAIFSGLNLAFFSLSRLQLELESSKGNEAAQKVLKLRNDSNFLLATILWGNVGINVLLTLLSDSVLAGLSSFLFSTIAITIIGEITPQAYFSRNALRMASLLSPVIRFYQLVFFIVAKPTALILDGWLGKEGITYLAESELKSIIRKHIEAEEAEIQHVEGIGALNFFALDEITVMREGEVIDPDSVIALPAKLDLPIFPEIDPKKDMTFLQQLHKSNRGWVIITNQDGFPLLAVDADGFLRAACFDGDTFDPYAHCHRPIVITDPNEKLSEIILKIRANHTFDKSYDGALDHDVVLVWGDEKRIITGADIFGRLLKGIATPHFRETENEKQPIEA
ncbi:Ancient conserved domain protein 4 [Pseudoalteromonas luteoviolacea B = ATCC 29581]|nr:Ancient conserved domain protein 4 [Pseudoalteromonas luteoviolacea B = ATCC 29581]